MITEQFKIVVRYMQSDSDWGTLKATDLKDKGESFINEVDELIEEYINFGERQFIKKYNRYSGIK